jgi:hypothetical protein
VIQTAIPTKKKLRSERKNLWTEDKGSKAENKCQMPNTAGSGINYMAQPQNTILLKINTYLTVFK